MGELLFAAGSSDAQNGKSFTLLGTAGLPMFVEFRTDYSNEGRGWAAQYAMVATERKSAPVVGRIDVAPSTEPVEHGPWGPVESALAIIVALALVLAGSVVWWQNRQRVVQYLSKVDGVRTTIRRRRRDTHPPRTATLTSLVAVE